MWGRCCYLTTLNTHFKHQKQLQPLWKPKIIASLVFLSQMKFSFQRTVFGNMETNKTFFIHKGKIKCKKFCNYSQIAGNIWQKKEVISHCFMYIQESQLHLVTKLLTTKVFCESPKEFITFSLNLPSHKQICDKHSLLWYFDQSQRRGYKKAIGPGSEGFYDIYFCFTIIL